MRTTTLANRAMKPLAAVLLLVGLAFPLAARAQSPNCDTPLDVVRLVHPLTRIGHKLMTGEPVTIVAMGSSSTWGAGASGNNWPPSTITPLWIWAREWGGRSCWPRNIRFAR